MRRGGGGDWDDFWIDTPNPLSPPREVGAPLSTAMLGRGVTPDTQWGRLATHLLCTQLWHTLGNNKTDLRLPRLLNFRSGGRLPIGGAGLVCIFGLRDWLLLHHTVWLWLCQILWAILGTLYGRATE